MDSRPLYLSRRLIKNNWEVINKETGNKYETEEELLQAVEQGEVVWVGRQLSMQKNASVN